MLLTSCYAPQPEKRNLGISVAKTNRPIDKRKKKTQHGEFCTDTDMSAS